MWITPKDITTVTAPAIIMHGVNCQGAMGSGVAKALYEKWCYVREEYVELPIEEMRLGNVQLVHVDNDLWVANCFTQEFYGSDGKRYADVEAINKCLEQIRYDAESLGIYNIYSPQIGCGLGGLDWESEVLPLFERFEVAHPTFNITICKI